jgi:hypothetical protein
MDYLYSQLKQVSFEVTVAHLHLHTLSIKCPILDIADLDMDASESSGRYWLRPQTCIINNNTTVAAILGYNTVTDVSTHTCNGRNC